MSDLNLPIQLGRYQITKLIAKGGMGEVFLAYDPICERNIAIKKIRHDLLKFKNTPIRFIQEAKIAAKLPHPSIIPIFDIIQDQEHLYYTMPYIEGESLRDIFYKTIESIKNQTIPHEIGSSIFSLSHIFLQVCQAIAFCHSKGILHRDIKPGNIMIGKFGQVLILDWGLAKEISDTSKDEEFEDPQSLESEDLTKPGKAVGTLSYLAPERALGENATVQTDIYSLGVVLYQILTLKLPFKRQSLKDFRHTAKFEKLIDPIEMAPYRDIPIQLAAIAKKCLQSDPKLRYRSLNELIIDLENYIEGKPDWIFQTEVSINRSDDWEFQENILLNRRLAITRSSYMMEWVALMISKASFSGNMKLVIHIEIEKHSEGVGFLFSIPEKSERTGLEDGFCLWVGTKKNPGFKLFRSNVELLSFPEQALKTGKKSELIIEKVDNRVKVTLDGESILHYVGYIPIVGTHIGLLSKDTDFKISSWKVYTGSQNAMVNCLSIPDAFLACKEFKKAYVEYLRIADSFRGRNEGREALFRAGVTLLEEAKLEGTQAQKYYLCDLAHLEFEKLKKTNGAPLEYLGKSLIYKFLQDIDEESKCLELALRKFPKNPLISLIKEELIFRLHESAKVNRFHTYLFGLLITRHIPMNQLQRETKLLIESLHEHLEPMIFQTPFLSEKPHVHLAMCLAFWLDKPHILLEIATKKTWSAQEKSIITTQCAFSFLYLNHFDVLQEFIDIFERDETQTHSNMHQLLQLLKSVAFFEDRAPQIILKILESKKIHSSQLKALKYLIHYKLFDAKKEELKMISSAFEHCQIEIAYASEFDCLKLELLLKQKRLNDCKPYFEIYASELKLPTSPFYTLYAVYSFAIKDEKELVEEFKKLFQLPHPPMHALFAHYLSGYITEKTTWFKKSFYYEKLELLRQLELLYCIKGKRSKQKSFQKKLLDLMQGQSKK